MEACRKVESVLGDDYAGGSGEVNELKKVKIKDEQEV